VEARLPTPVTRIVRACRHDLDRPPLCRLCDLILLPERAYRSAGGRDVRVWRCWSCYRDVVLVAVDVPRPCPCER
jgi:hypothetical protein